MKDRAHIHRNRINEHMITLTFRFRFGKIGDRKKIVSVSVSVKILVRHSVLLTHVVVVVALGYYSVYLTTTPLLVSSSVIFLAKSCVDKEFRKVETWTEADPLPHLGNLPDHNSAP